MGYGSQRHLVRVLDVYGDYGTLGRDLWPVQSTTCML
jgi:hypothetical protein